DAPGLRSRGSRGGGRGRGGTLRRPDPGTQRRARRAGRFGSSGRAIHVPRLPGAQGEGEGKDAGARRGQRGDDDPLRVSRTARPPAARAGGRVWSDTACGRGSGAHEDARRLLSRNPGGGNRLLRGGTATGGGYGRGGAGPGRGVRDAGSGGSQGGRPGAPAGRHEAIGRGPRARPATRRDAQRRVSHRPRPRRGVERLIKGFLLIAVLMLGVAPGASAQGGADSITIARLQYGGGGDWYANPSSLPNLLTAVRERTGIP